MKKLIFAIFTIICLCGCSTYNYNTQIPKKDEPVNPYDQQPAADYGIAHAVRGFILSKKR